VAIEFALAAPPFFIVLFFIVALSLHLFEQELLDLGLHVAVRQVQTGNAQNVVNGTAFINSYLCPATGGMLSCPNLYVQVQKATFLTGQDYYNLTSGTGLTSGGNLDLANFSSALFCNSGPSQFILVTAIYTGPTILGSLLPGVLSVSYGGSPVDAIMARVGAVTEDYTVQAAQGTVAASC
jgi:Flp pilus assembly protein TadG